MMKLKNCKCGWMPLIVVNTRFHKHRNQVWCPMCYAMSKEKRTKRGAIKDWNRRADNEQREAD